MIFKGMLVEQIGLEVEADSEEQAEEKLLDIITEKLTTDDVIVWETGEELG